MPGPALVVSVTGDTEDLTTALSDSTSGINSFVAGWKTSFSGLGGVIGTVTQGIGALVDMGKAAADDAAEQSRLEQAIKNAGAATSGWQQTMTEAIAKSQDRAFTDSESREALGQLVTATGSLDEATRLLNMSQDLARSGGTDLATAVDAVAKASEGSYRGLQQYGVMLDSSMAPTEALGAAWAASAGQADLFAESAAGGALRASDGMNELGETIGTALLPIMEELGPALTPIIEALGELIEAILPLLIPAIQLLATVLTGALGIIKDLITWVTDLIEDLGRWWGTMTGAIATVLKPFQDALQLVVDVINAIGGAVDTAIGWIGDLGGAIGGALGTIGDLLDALADIASASNLLPGWIVGEHAPTGGGLGNGNPSGGFFSAPITINTGGDPAAVVRAVRRYGTHNGGAWASHRRGPVVARGW